MTKKEEIKFSSTMTILTEFLKGVQRWGKVKKTRLIIDWSCTDAVASIGINPIHKRHIPGLTDILVHPQWDFTFSQHRHYFASSKTQILLAQPQWLLLTLLRRAVSAQAWIRFKVNGKQMSRKTDDTSLARVYHGHSNKIVPLKFQLESSLHSRFIREVSCVSTHYKARFL